MMEPIVMSALISGLCVALPSLLATVLSNRAHDKVTDEKMRQTGRDIAKLSERVDKHNNLIERMAIVERDLKTAWRQIDDIKEEKK